MAANIIARYVWLVDIIRRNKKVSFQDINRLWKQSGLNDSEELQLRTFHRHRIAIEEIFGINMSTSPFENRLIDHVNSPLSQAITSNNLYQKDKDGNVIKDGFRLIVEHLTSPNVLR